MFEVEVVECCFVYCGGEGLGGFGGVVVGEDVDDVEVLEVLDEF